MGQTPAGNRTRNYQSATHFYSKDGGARWQWTGNSAGVVASCDPLAPAGSECPGKEAANDCPDDLGVYSGSTTFVNGVPHYAYPGVHLYNYQGKGEPNPNGVTMSQCFATPADPSDPALAQWKKTTIIPQSQIPHGVSQHFHDDSTAFKLNGREHHDTTGLWVAPVSPIVAQKKQDTEATESPDAKRPRTEESDEEEEHDDLDMSKFFSRSQSRSRSCFSGVRAAQPSRAGCGLANGQRCRQTCPSTASPTTRLG